MTLVLAASAPVSTAKCGCYRCGTPYNVVLTGDYIEGEGTLGLCVRCIGEMARHIGWISPDEAETLRAKVAAAHDSNKGLGKENANLRDENAHLRALVGKGQRTYRGKSRPVAEVAGVSGGEAP